MNPSILTLTSSTPPLPTGLGELVEQLGGLQAALNELLELAARKLAALRRADTAALEACAAQEEEVLKGLWGKERARDAALARVAQSLRCPGGARPRLGQIAERLPEPLASSLRARSAGLQEIALDLQQKNRLVASVAHRLQSHIRGIFADVARAAQESVVYGARGQFEVGRPRCWVDAVG